MKSSQDYDLKAALGYQLKLTNYAHEKRLESLLREVGLNRVAFTVLFAIGRAGRSQPSEIAHYLQIEPPAISRALRKLESDGLIVAARAEADKRIRIFGLSPLGMSKLDAGIEAAVKASSVIYAALTDKEIAEFRSSLDKIRGPGEVRFKEI